MKTEERNTVEKELTLKKVRELGLLAVVRGESRAAALDVVGALVEGGVVGIEVTFTTPEAPEVMRDLDAEHGDEILLGSGTITAKKHIEESVEAGAKFLVSPGCDPELLASMLDTGLASFPGTLTPSEVMLADRLGASAVKLFPGSSGGPSYLKALRGPFPSVTFVPTGGVSLGNVAEWFEAGAFAVGAGSSLAPSSLDGRDRSEVVENARKFAEAARDARQKQSGL